MRPPALRSIPYVGEERRVEVSLLRSARHRAIVLDVRRRASASPPPTAPTMEHNLPRASIARHDPTPRRSERHRSAHVASRNPKRARIHPPSTPRAPPRAPPRARPSRARRRDHHPRPRVREHAPSRARARRKEAASTRARRPSVAPRARNPSVRASVCIRRPRLVLCVRFVPSYTAYRRQCLNTTRRSRAPKP